MTSLRLFLYKTIKKFVEGSDPDTSSHFRTTIILLLRRWIQWDLHRLDLKRQKVLRKGAKQGKRLPLESAIKVLDDMKAGYINKARESGWSLDDTDDDDFFQKIDKLKDKIRHKYPDGIPIDEAWQLTEEGGWDKFLQS